jgi:carbon-monoxide dehydrogenase medium subunit
MKPPPFDYAAPKSIPEVIQLLQEAPEDTSLLAGGQSLVPMLNMRLAQPELLIDLNRVEGLDAIEAAANGRVRFGSMVRQLRLEKESQLRARLPLMSEAIRHVAHTAIRTRGTSGGSLVHADPAAELPATVCALDGRLLVRGAGGDRTIDANEFFLGPLTTAIQPGELLIGVEVDPPPSGAGWRFVEVARTHGAFALAAVAALVRLDGGGRIDHIRLVLAGVGGVPYVPDWLDEASLGEAPGETLFRRIGERVRDEVEPYDDVHASADYRKRVAGVLATRALSSAAVRTGERIAA